MNLPKEWEEIASDSAHFGGNRREAVERCYALHCEPPRELTDSELVETYAAASFSIAGPFHTPERVKALRAVIAAHEAKQREPKTVTFRAARNSKNGLVDMFPLKPNGEVDNEYFHYAGWEWLDVDGKPQTVEVKLSWTI